MCNLTLEGGRAAAVLVGLDIVQHTVRFSVPQWTVLRDCGRKKSLISLSQGLSASVMFAPQVCWLLADCCAVASSYQSTESKQKPTQCLLWTKPGPLITHCPRRLMAAIFSSRYLDPLHTAFYHESFLPCYIQWLWGECGYEVIQPKKIT